MRTSTALRHAQSCARICLHKVRGFRAELHHRGVLRIRGDDAPKFLHNLCTSDVHELARNGPGGGVAASATCFLNRRGRVQFDAMLVHEPPTASVEGAPSFLLDVDRSVLQQVIKQLKMYRLRSKVDISDVSASHRVWSVAGVDGGGADKLLSPPTEDNGTKEPKPLLFADPRLRSLGVRAILPRNVQWSAQAPRRVSRHVYDLLRILHGVPEGSSASGGDFAGDELPLEYNLDRLGEVSFEKGCYVGQELTARTHFTGVIRKRLLPLIFSGDGSDDDDVTRSVVTAREHSLGGGHEALFPPEVIDYQCAGAAYGAALHRADGGGERACGETRSSRYNLALALVRVDALFASDEDLVSAPMRLGKRVAVAWKPSWLR